MTPQDESDLRISDEVDTLGLDQDNRDIEFARRIREEQFKELEKEFEDYWVTKNFHRFDCTEIEMLRAKDAYLAGAAAGRIKNANT